MKIPINMFLLNTKILQAKKHCTADETAIEASGGQRVDEVAREDSLAPLSTGVSQSI